MSYMVSLVRTITETLEIDEDEASNAEEAADLAEERSAGSSLCHQCSSEHGDLEDINRIIVEHNGAVELDQ